MTAQLNNQDPFAPVDNTQMVAQMAQFSSLAGITDMNTTLKAISDKLTGTSTSDAMSYVGRTVLTEGDTAYGRTSGGIAGGIELDGDATDVTVSIQSPDGQVLKTMSLGAQSKGTINYDWDGKTDGGADAGHRPVQGLRHRPEPRHHRHQPRARLGAGRIGVDAELGQSRPDRIRHRFGPHFRRSPDRLT